MNQPVYKASPFAPAGDTGLKVFSGVVDEEFLLQLAGPRGAKIYQEMSENDATTGAILSAVELLVRPVSWRVVAATNDGPGQQAAEFVESCMGDMEYPWEDLMSEILTMLPYGWSYHEMIMKRRLGPNQADPTMRSKYNDGLIGFQRISPRSQISLARWELGEDSVVQGMWQYGANGGENFIPIERSLHFRTTSRRNNPEGRSVLRSAYRSWYFMKRVQEHEAIGVERELAGLPVVKVPVALLNSQEPGDVTALNSYKKIARDIKFNEQGGLVIPSDPYTDAEGRPVAGTAKVSVELLSTAGRRAIDTNITVVRYERDIARSILADFLMLGTDGGRGSYALSEDKSNMFLRSVETTTWQIASQLNKRMVPRLWALNGLPPETMPRIEPGKVAPPSMKELGEYLRNITLAGFAFSEDAEVQSHVREVGGLPSADSGADVL